MRSGATATEVRLHFRTLRSEALACLELSRVFSYPSSKHVSRSVLGSGVSVQQPGASEQAHQLRVRQEPFASTDAHSWTLDWTKQIVSGSATHQLQVLKDGVKEAIFDTSYLDIEKVIVNGQPTKWELGERHHVLGSALHIPLAKQHKQGDEIELRVDYSTTSKCTTLGWLTAEQTPSKKLPFVYSQSQAIHSRCVRAECDS